MEQVHSTLTDNEFLCLNKRNQFLNCLRSHIKLMKTIIAEQKKLLERIFVLSTKLNVLEKGCITSLPYPKELTWKVKGEILHQLNSDVQKISQYIKQRSKSFNTLRLYHQEFALLSKTIDWNKKSHLNNGSATEKPLVYYTERAFEIMYCLGVYENSIKRCNEQFDVRMSDSIVAYLKTVPLSDNFYDLITEVLLNSHLIDKYEKMK